MLVKEMIEVLGGDIMKGNTKMPCTTFGLSTAFCGVGGLLREKHGSTCEGCYAKRLENFRPSVKQGWTNRTLAVLKATETPEGMALWVDAFVERLNKVGRDYHRWHDSGDVQNDRHMSMIISVAQRMPHIKFWLPTREKRIVNNALRAVGKFPPNLCVRLSMPMVDMVPVGFFGTTSTVHSKGMPNTGHLCPASTQGNACGDCRACWNTEVSNVSYPKH